MSRIISGGVVIMKKALCLAVAILGFFTFCLIPDPGSRALANKLGTELELTAVPAASVAFLSLGGYITRSVKYINFSFLH